MDIHGQQIIIDGQIMIDGEMLVELARHSWTLLSFQIVQPLKKNFMDEK
jgi:hypothetical protein